MLKRLIPLLKVYSYRLVDLDNNYGQARVSVWPTWPLNGETPKSIVVPLNDLEEGAMEFDLWKEIGEEFLTTSTGILVLLLNKCFSEFQ